MKTTMGLVEARRKNVVLPEEMKLNNFNQHCTEQPH
jgi:hypothetical protein